MSRPYVKGAILSATKSLFPSNTNGSDAGGPVAWAPRRSSVSMNDEVNNDVLQSIKLPRGAGRVTQVVFHRKGDYFSTLCESPMSAATPLPPSLLPVLLSSAPIAHRTSFFSCCWQWHGPQCCLDSPGQQAPLAGTVQERQRHCPKNPLPPHQTPLLRCGEWLRSERVVLVTDRVALYSVILLPSHSLIYCVAPPPLLGYPPPRLAVQLRNMTHHADSAVCSDVRFSRTTTP